MAKKPAAAKKTATKKTNSDQSAELVASKPTVKKVAAKKTAKSDSIFEFRHQDSESKYISDRHKRWGL